MSRADKLTLWAIFFFVLAAGFIPAALGGNFVPLAICAVVAAFFTGWSFKVAIRGH